MLEIIALYFLCKRMGENLRDKGWRTTIWMQIAVVLTWFGCMLLGGVAYGIYVFIKEGEAATQNPGPLVYLIAFLSAAAGVGVLFLITSLLPAKRPTTM